MKTKIEKLTVSAVMIALATVLSMITVWKMPYGGSITLLSMVPIVLVSVRYGIGWGLCSGFLYSVIQFAQDGFALNWGLSGTVWIVCMLFDYLFPFTLIGLAGIFRSKGRIGVIVGTAMVLVLRFASHFTTGFTIWASNAADYGFTSPALYSLFYNGQYMLPELIFTTVAVAIICFIPQGKRLMKLK